MNRMSGWGHSPYRNCATHILCSLPIKKSIYIIIYIAILLSACNKHDEPEVEPVAERTVIVYMMAENTLARFARYDSVEMANAVGQIPANCNLLLYKDDTRLPLITRMNSAKGIHVWKRYTRDQDSADSLVMLRTLTEMTQAFPSRHYALVLWSHGSGWIPKRKTIGIDNNTNSAYSNRGTEMEITTLRGILEQLPHMDFIMFDACSMQNVEVAHELRQVTDYLIGSPSEIPGNGAPYDYVMPSMMQGDAMAVAEHYYQYYVNGAGVALSVVDCKMMDSLALATAPLVDSLWAGMADVYTDTIQHYVPFYTSQHRPEGQDICGMMHALLPADKYAAWNRVLQQTVPWHKATNQWTTVYAGTEHHTLTDPDHYSGLSMFVPSEKYAPYGWNELFHRTSWYAAAGWRGTGW